MSISEIQSIISSGESFDVEFKGEEKRPLSDGELVEAIVCLGNRVSEMPGWLLIGVEDGGRITGARPRHEAGITDPLRLLAMISGRTRPSLTVNLSLPQIGGKQIIAIQIPPLRQPIGTTDGKYLRRAIGSDGRPACMPMHFHEMQSLQSSRGLLDYSAAVVSEATWADLDPLEFERMRRRIRESQGRGDAALMNLPDIEIAKALGAVEANGTVRAIRVLGLLLFGREEALRFHLPAQEAAFQVLQGLEVKVNDFFRWPLIRLMEEIEARFRARNQETELMIGMTRIGVQDYPESAFREGIANALIHRDYTRLGAIHIQWHPDRIEISNPGGFPEGVRLDNLLVTAPHPRNPLLADAFKRAGIVERTARGIDMIFHEHLKSGHPTPFYSPDNRINVKLTLPGGPADLNIARLVLEADRADKPLALEDLLILNLLRDGNQTGTSEIAALIQKSDEDTQLFIQRLIETGLIVSRDRKGLTYSLSSKSNMPHGKRTAFDHELETEGRSKDQVILEHIKKHGSITRQSVCSLLNINSAQAYRLLKNVLNKGLIMRIGSRGRNVEYRICK